MVTVTPFLMFQDRLPEAVKFYASVFKDAKIVADGSHGSATFELAGQRFHGFNGGPHFRFAEGVSFMVGVETQAEVDYYWTGLIGDGGAASKCGWLRDPFGLSWQVVPAALGHFLSAPDRAAAGRALKAMLGMEKIVIAELQAAFDGR